MNQTPCLVSEKDNSLRGECSQLAMLKFSKTLYIWLLEMPRIHSIEVDKSRCYAVVKHLIFQNHIECFFGDHTGCSYIIVTLMIRNHLFSESLVQRLRGVLLSADRYYTFETSVIHGNRIDVSFAQQQSRWMSIEGCRCIFTIREHRLKIHSSIFSKRSMLCKYQWGLESRRN
jgi:hypothetical protein